jgi:hypothetical protein
VGLHLTYYLMGRESLQSRDYSLSLSFPPEGYPPKSHPKLTRYYPPFRAAIPLNWTGPHVLLSRLPLSA